MIINIHKIQKAHAQKRLDAITQSLPELSPWFPWAHSGLTLQQSEHWIEEALVSWDKGKDYIFAIVSEHDGSFLGEVKIMDVKHDYGELNAALGYWVRTDSTQQGVAKQAILQAAKFAFKELKLIRLNIMVQVDNIPSQKTAESISAQYEGFLRNQWCFNKPTVYGVKLYSLIPEDIGLDTQAILTQDS